VTTGGAEIVLIVNDFEERWSFNANRDHDLTARGEFELTTRIFGSLITAHGDIVCFTVSGNQARLGGIVTQSNSASFVGTTVIWSVADNGEGKNSPPDEATSYKPGDPTTHCLGVDPPDYLPVQSGNVQVRE
jgi:hypothetical protein